MIKTIYYSAISTYLSFYNTKGVILFTYSPLQCTSCHCWKHCLTAQTRRPSAPRPGAQLLRQRWALRSRHRNPEDTACLTPPAPEESAATAAGVAEAALASHSSSSHHLDEGLSRPEGHFFRPPSKAQGTNGWARQQRTGWRAVASTQWMVLSRAFCDYHSQLFWGHFLKRTSKHPVYSDIIPDSWSCCRPDTSCLTNTGRVADRVLVLWPGVRPVPLRWESRVQDIGPPETSRLHIISNGESSPRDLHLNAKTQLHSKTSKLQCWTPYAKQLAREEHNTIH